MQKIIPLILSGGSGTRLWPLSRASKPKQFLSFEGGRSLFQETVLRCADRTVFNARPIVAAAEAHRFLVAEDLEDIGTECDILLEPVARNSCAAIAAGCFQALARAEDAVVLVLAADHRIQDAAAFTRAVEQGLPDAAGGQFITFGIRPDYPSTAYGYIKPGQALSDCYRVSAFVEKPPVELAQTYIREGYYWNSGNFLFQARSFLQELSRLEPAIYEAVEKAHIGRTEDLNFLRLGVKAFTSSPSISVDYAVMERTDCAAVLPVDYGWSDVGSWDAVASVLPRDDDENTIVGDAKLVDSRNNLVHSKDRLATLIGIENIMVVSTRDSLLIVQKTKSEEVKKLVSALQDDGRVEANEALQMFRPWGNYERLDIGPGYQVKRIVVKPGGVLSLQKHRHRAEHWVVVQGLAEVTIGEKVQTVGPSQSVYVPLGEVHRLANRGDTPVVLIEVQTGSYLGEDDIVRLEDTYNRIPEIAGEAP
jgi:mannose-1-phosphate guanylyltransferase/mannose-6-phosphate isomerase